MAFVCWATDISHVGLASLRWAGAVLPSVAKLAGGRGADQRGGGSTGLVSSAVASS